MAKRTNLEQITFDSLEKVVRFYDACESDEQKIHHLSNGISLLRSLQNFLQEKMKMLKVSGGEEVTELTSSSLVSVLDEKDRE